MTKDNIKLYLHIQIRNFAHEDTFVGQQVNDRVHFPHETFQECVLNGDEDIFLLDNFDRIVGSIFNKVIKYEF